MPKVQAITTYPTDATIAKVKRIAESENRSISYVANELIEEAIEARELERRGLSGKGERRKA